MALMLKIILSLTEKVIRHTSGIDFLLCKFYRVSILRLEIDNYKSCLKM
jgi:hypothetical protein